MKLKGRKWTFNFKVTKLGATSKEPRRRVNINKLKKKSSFCFEVFLKTWQARYLVLLFPLLDSTQLCRCHSKFSLQPFDTWKNRCQSQFCCKGWSYTSFMFSELVAFDQWRIYNLDKKLFSKTTFWNYSNVPSSSVNNTARSIYSSLTNLRHAWQIILTKISCPDKCRKE